MGNDQMETKRRLLSLLKDVELVKEYLRKYGYSINAKNINDIKYGGKGGGVAAVPAKPVVAAPAAAGKSAPAAAAGGAPIDPVYETSVSCPICLRTKIRCYELRAKSQQVTQTIFLVPVYSGTKEYLAVDYTRLAVTVCPSCLFASPDRKNFNYPSVVGGGEEKSTLSVSVISNMKDSIEARKALLPAAVDNPNYFVRERSTAVAIESYKLAMARAKEEADIQQPYGFFKLGSYALKIAHMQRHDGTDDTAALTEALGFFQKSFQKSECQNEELEMQAIYLIVALNLRLGDHNQANSYISVFGKLRAERTEQMKKTPSLTTACIDKWHDKAKFLWDERGNPDYFIKNS